MRTSRKIALALAAFAACTLLALVAVPFLFRDRIASRLKGEINRSVDARVSWTGAGLSVLRDFPNVSLSLAGVWP